MKKWFKIIFFILPFFGYGQVYRSVLEEVFSENVSQFAQQELTFDLFLDDFENKIGTLNREEVNNKSVYDNLLFLTPEEKNEINKYLQKYSSENCICFVNRLAIQNNKKWLLKMLFNYESIRNENRKLLINQVIGSRTGRDENNNIFQRFYLKYEHRNISFNFQTEKDLGERKWWDYSSFSWKWSSGNNKVILGDFEARIGNGLFLNQQYSPPRLVDQFFYSTRIRPHTSVRESQFIRGLSIQKKIKNNTIRTFFGRQFLDVNIQQGNIRSFPSLGIRNTDLEKSRKHNAYQDLLFIGWSKMLGRYSAENSLLTWKFSHKLEDHHSRKYFFAFNHKSTLNFKRILWSFELAVPDYDQLSFRSQIHYSLGNQWYYSMGYLMDNSNSFRSLTNDLGFSSEKERILYYGLMYKSKNHQFNHQYSKSLIQNDWKWLSRQEMNFWYQYRLQNRSSIQFFSNNRSFDQEYFIQTRLRFLWAKRGLWNFSQEWQAKWLPEKAWALHTKIIYIGKRIPITFGSVMYQQQNGAFYFYETDVYSLGRVRGFYGNGNTLYSKVDIRLNTHSMAFKLGRDFNENGTSWRIHLAYKYIFR